MSDLVERLRGTWSWPPSEVMAEAADRIEQLEAALRDIIKDSYSLYAISVARAALGEERT